MILKKKSPSRTSSRSIKQRRKLNYGNKRQNGNGTTKIVIVSLAVIVFLSLIVFSFTLLPKLVRSPEDTVVKFSEEFNDGRYKKMLRYVEPSEAKTIHNILDMLPSGISENALETILPFVSDITNTKLYPEIINTTKGKRTAIVKVQFKDLDNNHYYNVHLTKKNGIWYIRYCLPASEE
ncbi:MAG: DUF4878 domain-containing protein [Ruminococcus sp.]|nr:DUF4878 domain-containing protein [Ruminococcus sp.]